MTIEHDSHEDRRYTLQHDRILQALVRQITELNDRVQFLEQTVDSSSVAPTDEERRSAYRTRASSTALAEEIASIGLSLDAVIASIETAPTPRADHERFDDDGAFEDHGAFEDQRGLEGDEATEPSIVDLSSAPRRPMWRAANTRPAGWQPVATRRAG